MYKVLFHAINFMWMLVIIAIFGYYIASLIPDFVNIGSFSDFGDAIHYLID